MEQEIVKTVPTETLEKIEDEAYLTSNMEALELVRKELQLRNIAKEAIYRSVAE